MTFGPPGLTCHLLTSVLIASTCSGFQHGYNVIIINTPADTLKNWINQTHFQNYHHRISPNGLSIIWSILTSIYCLGGIIGALSVGLAIRMVGSRKALAYNNLLVVVGVLLEFSAKYVGYYEFVITGRLIIGVNSGINSGLCTVYVCDLSPQSLRGAMGSMYQVWLTGGMIIGSTIGLAEVLGNGKSWQFMLAVPIVPAVLQLVLMLFYAPESPRHLLIIKKEQKEAIKVLVWLRGPEADIEDEIQTLIDEQASLKNLPRITMKNLHRQDSLKKPLILVIILMVAQQMSGIVTVAFFSSQTLEQAGLSHVAMELTNIGGACLSTVITVVSMAVLVEKFGRKPLLVISLTVIALSQSLLMACLKIGETPRWVPYLSIASTYSIVIGYGIGLGSIPWFLTSEMVPQNAKPTVQSVAVGVHWSMVFLIALSFPPLAGALGYFVFLFYIVSCVLAVGFVVLCVPETKDKTLGEVQRFFRGKV